MFTYLFPTVFTLPVVKNFKLTGKKRDKFSEDVQIELIATEWNRSQMNHSTITSFYSQENKARQGN